MKEKTKIGGKTNNNDELDKRDYYYMPAKVPKGYEFHSITVESDTFCSIYVEKGKEYEPFEVFDFAYFNVGTGLTIEEAIKVNELVQSQYSEKIYFWYENHLERYSYAYFELDNHVLYIRFPYEISLDNEEQVKMIEELCDMKKKKIR